MITSIGGDLSPYLIDYLKTKSIHKDLNIIGIDNKETVLGQYFTDDYEKVPHGDSSKYITKIIKLIKKYKINLIIPTSDEEALNLSKNRSKIEKLGVTLVATEYKNLKIFSDKAKTYQKMSELNFNIPKWYEAKNKKDLLKFTNDFIKTNKNFIIKPSSTRGSRGFSVITKKSSLRNLAEKYKNLYPLIISEQLFEPIYDLDLLSWKGKLIKGVVRRRINAADPNEGHIIVNNKKIIQQGKKIVNFFNLSWLYDCDFMLDKNGNPVLIEINPRMSGSATVSMAAGVPLFDDIISLARNKSVRKTKIPIGTKVIAFQYLKKI